MTSKHQQKILVYLEGMLSSRIFLGLGRLCHAYPDRDEDMEQQPIILYK
jgi:hypothetical protein